MSGKNEQKTLNQQLAELDDIIAWFDQDDFDLDHALAKFDEGVVLADAIKERLATFENKVTVLKERFDRPTSEG